MNQKSNDMLNRYLNSRHLTSNLPGTRNPRHAVAISRETGAGAFTVTQMAVELLEQKQSDFVQHPWAAFDRNLVKEMIEDHRLPPLVKHYMPEDAVNRMSDFSEEMFGLHPSTRTLVQKMNQTIFRLAVKGNAILVGRGAHLITAPLSYVLRVRLVASLEFRIRHIESYHHINYKEAADFVRKEDAAKVRYLRRNFKSNPHHPLNFDLTINTGTLGFLESATLIADAVMALKSGDPNRKESIAL